jgi:hypothetical protein
MKKVIVSMCIIALLVCAGNAPARMWVGNLGTGDGISWNSNGNWSDDGVNPVPAPTATDNVQAINIPGYGPTVNAAGAVANQVDVGTWGWNGTLTVTSAGNLAAGFLTVAGDAGLTGAVTNAGTISSTSGLQLGINGAGTLTNSGTMTVGSLAAGLGINANSSGVLTNSGTINVTGTGWFVVGFDGYGEINMNGGAINVGSDIKFGLNATGSSHINLYGGTITAAGGLGLNGNGLNTMNITEGIMIGAGDSTVGALWMASVGLITAYGGTGIVHADYNTGTNQTTLWAEVPEPATMILLGLGGLLLRKKR